MMLVPVHMKFLATAKFVSSLMIGFNANGFLNSSLESEYINNK